VGRIPEAGDLPDALTGCFHHWEAQLLETEIKSRSDNRGLSAIARGQELSMNETATYVPEHFKTVKRVFDRAIRYQLDPTEGPARVHSASSETLQTLSAEELLLPWNLQNHLEVLIDGLRRNRWRDDPVAGNEAIKQFYSHLNEEMKRLGLL
jgi:hypothetical protein